MRTVVEDALGKILDQLEKRHVRKDWLTNKEAMGYLELSKTTLQRYRAAGMLPYSKIGGSIFYHLSDLRTLLETYRIG